MKRIKIKIARDGTQSLEVLGAAGPECLDFTRALEKRLGHTQGERRLKPAYDDAPEGDERERQEEHGW